MVDKLRLDVISDGNGLDMFQKLQVLPIKLLTGKYPGPLLVLSYKRRFFGKAFGTFLQECMRKQKHWTVGEIELFASFTALQLKCHY